MSTSNIKPQGGLEMIRIEQLLRHTDFNLLSFLHYTFQGKIRTATILLYLACLKAFRLGRDDLLSSLLRKDSFNLSNLI